MPVPNAQAGDRVDDGEVRVALERMAASDAFRGSPQLISFLRYVVEARLRGQADRIKGYTIAVEALGRAPDFDPQADPIVRVEATRLRRALTRYHSCAIDDEVIIELPLGSYVPVFRRAATHEVLPLPALAPPSPPGKRPGRLAWRRINWRRAAAGLVLMALGAAGYAGLDSLFDLRATNGQQVMLAGAAPSRTPPDAPRVPTIFPVIYVGPFQGIGTPNAPAIADLLRAKLRDALARFDEIHVIGDPPPEDGRALKPPGDAASSGQYHLTASVEASEIGFSFNVRLTDIADGRVAYARSYRQFRGGEATPAEEGIVREVAAALAQPYGIIHSRERARHLGSAGGHQHYRCLIEAYEYWRTNDTTELVRARDCLERATEADPSFAAGFAMLAEIVLQEHRRGLAAQPGAAPPLERALRAARRACELKPGGAGAHQALMDVHFFRGEYALALAAGDKAVMLNPYNPIVLALYGARLIALGERDKGARYVTEAASFIVVRPPWHDFYLFLAAYLADDPATAASHAGQMASGTFPLGLLAQALVAAQRGEAQAARQLVERLVVLQPGWRDGPRHELKKMFPSDAVTDRLARDLTQALVGAID